jgi:hypothetical protein
MVQVRHVKAHVSRVVQTYITCVLEISETHPTYGMIHLRFVTI